jgi:hypothetical protein
MRNLLIAATLALTLPAMAQTLDREAFEQILLPISFIGEIEGAHGTRWTSSILMFNGSEQTVQFVGATCPEVDPAACIPARTLGPRTYVHVQTPPGPLASQGAFLYVTRSVASQVWFAANLRDLSRAEENAGTELPVVREAEFHHRIILPMVLLRGPFRTALRIYSLSEAPAQVRVRMYRLDQLDPLVDEVVALDGIVSIIPNLFPSGPAYHHIFDLIGRWPQLEAATSVRIELESDFEIWALASQTNDVTQLVTTVRPQ